MWPCSFKNSNGRVPWLCVVQSTSWNSWYVGRGGRGSDCPITLHKKERLKNNPKTRPCWSGEGIHCHDCGVELGDES